MRAILETWLELEWIRAVDLQFALHLSGLAQAQKAQEPAQQEQLTLLLCLLSHQVGRGHVCIELDALCANPSLTLAIPPQDRRYSLQQRELLRRAQEQQSQEQSPAQLLAALGAEQISEILLHSGLASTGEEVTPLVLQQGRLYMRRYWLYERAIADAIQARLNLRKGLEEPESMQSQQLKRTLARLFKPSDGADYQRAACALAARSRFSLITGGPGTGKTTTVIKLLALLQSMAAQDPATEGRKYQIELAAPTGKAAARLNESIRSAIDQLPFESFDGELKPADLPTKVRTLHRLLGSRRYSREFRHNLDNPLALDVLVIDEASMVDLSMLAAVVAALPDHAQLILIGDQDQLASVEAGSVLGELCARSREGHYLPETLNWLAQVAEVQAPVHLEDKRGTPLDQSVAMLRHSYRFDASSGISKLAQAINTGVDLKQTLAECHQQKYSDIAFLHPERKTQTEANEALLKLLEQHACKGYAGYLRLAHSADLSEQERNRSAKEILEAYTHFQLLTPLRQGDFGVSELNLRVTRQLHQQGAIDSQQEWYHGRPIMVSANDYNVGLMNGDIGICLNIDARPLIAFMPDDADGQIRWIPPSRLPAHETVFAMTVHKSQGSEFTHCSLVIPPQDSPVLTRELVYTAITRAKREFSLLCDKPALLPKIAQRRTERASGLGEAMFGVPLTEGEEFKPETAGSEKPTDRDGQLDLF